MFNTDINNALTRANSNLIAQYALPSDNFINLTLGASETEYTAPDNGYFTIDKATTSGQYLILYNKTTNLITQNRSTNTGQTVSVFLPVKKGDTVVCKYNAGGTVNYFRFIYAGGAI